MFIIDALNTVIWEYVLVYGLLAIGVFFTIRLRFFQFVSWGEMWRTTRGSDARDKDGISPFAALAVSLASRVGTGNLAGVAVALTLGGPGAIFWMWIVALIGMATSFAETVLAQLYKVHGPDGTYRGGPAHYITRGLGMPVLGTVFALCVIFAIGMVMNGTQANSISESMNSAFGIPGWVSGVVVALGVMVVTAGGLRGVSRVAELLVPVMAVIYMAVVVGICVMNAAELPAVISEIISSAFGLQEAAGGAAGGVMAAILNGVKRGLYSNEAGMGTAPNIAATATPDPRHPASQGFVQAFGVFVDTILICTATAAMILLSDAHLSGADGVVMTQTAACHFLGDFGMVFVAIVILLFAFTTVIASYSYAETAMVYMGWAGRVQLIALRSGLMAVMIWGAVQPVKTVFAVTDLAMGAMSAINLFALALMSSTVVTIARDFRDQRKSGKTPEFHISKHPQIAKGVDADIWS